MAAVTDWRPYPKSVQLGGQRKRYRRRVASPKQWAAIRAEKIERAPCRVCGIVFVNVPGMDAHHLIPRDQFGDDVADNIVPLCRDCHTSIERLHPKAAIVALLASLSDAEYAYAVDRAGEDFAERIYRMEYTR